MNYIWLDEVVRRALEEDIGPGDLTVQSVVPPGPRPPHVRAKAEGVIAGTAAAARAFQLLDCLHTVPVGVGRHHGQTRRRSGRNFR